jgi:NTE family protein
MGTRDKTIGVVMAGAVAQGAFEAGVLRALASCDGIRIARIVAASSGALNGVVLAAAACRGDLRGGAAALEGLWRAHASWREVLHPSLRHWLARDGALDQAGILKLLRDHVAPVPPEHARAVELRMIVAPLQGTDATIARTSRDGTVTIEPATTFEACRDFTAADLSSPARLAEVFRVATASAAFPIVFAPVRLEGLGLCVDGGAVNNTPLRRMLEGPCGATLDAVIVIATSVQHRTVPAPELRGVGLVTHLAETLIGERLYRELREAGEVSGALYRLDELVRRGRLTPDQLGDVLAALDWADRRPVDIVAIRPTVALRKDPFRGFFSRRLRGEHFDLGVARGREVLRGAGWLA